jgi:hypothetical protein
MATKNYAKMSSKSLVALLGNDETTDEERAAIQEVLDDRVQKTAGVSQETSTVVEVDADDAELSEDEVKAKEAEVAARQAIMDGMREMVGHKAQVVPFNTATWVDGVVTGVLDDQRAKNPLWIVKDLESGKVIRKAYGSELIKVSEDEKIAITKNVRAQKGAEYTEKEIMDQLADAYQQIGKFAEITEFSNKDGEVTKALIIGAMHEKRSNRVMYRMRSEVTGKTVHKVYGNGVKVLEEIDPEIFAKNAEKREKASTLSDPAKRAEYIAKEIEQLQSQLVQLQEKIDAKKQALTEAEAEAAADANLE